MNRKFKIKIAVDVLMTISLLFLMSFELIGDAAHEWLGMAMVFLFLVRREDSSYPFLFFIQMRYSPSVMRVSRYRMGVQHASRMGMGRLPVA